MKPTAWPLAGLLMLLSSLSVCLSGSVLAADFSFTLTSDVQGATATSQYPAVLNDIAATGGPGVFMIFPGDAWPPNNGGVDGCLRAKFGQNFVWYPVVGNHELDNADYMQWTRNQYYSLPYIVNPGPPNCTTTTYSFDYGNAHFVVLNEYYNGTSDVGTDGNIVPALYNWLAADLAATTKKWIFVTGHEPAYPQCDTDYPDQCRHIGDSLDQYPTNRNAFWALLDTYDVVAYFCGHTHTYYRYLKNGVWEVNNAYARGTGTYDTYIRVTVGEDTVTFDAHRSLGRGYFTKHDTWSVYRPSTPLPPIIAEVAPDPDIIKVGKEYTRQLTLLQGYPAPTWSVITGPSGVQVSGTGFVSGWTPAAGQVNQTFAITIRATNTQGNDNESWQVRVVSRADFDLDDDVDLEDFGFLQKCYSGSTIPYAPGCGPADIDGDGDVDQADYNLFKSCLTGPTRPPGC